MKKSVKRIAKGKISPADKKNARRHTAKQAGYNEEIYNGEQQSAYQKSDDARGDEKNTSGPTA